mgnify:FL=1
MSRIKYIKNAKNIKKKPKNIYVNITKPFIKKDEPESISQAEQNWLDKMSVYHSMGTNEKSENETKLYNEDIKKE